MQTREQYLCVSFEDRTCGLQVDTDEDIIATRPELEQMLLTATGRDDFEAKLRERWPGRAYWIEVGDASCWVQVCEFNAFAGKPHKRVQALLAELQEILNA